MAHGTWKIHSDFGRGNPDHVTSGLGLRGV